MFRIAWIIQDNFEGEIDYEIEFTQPKEWLTHGKKVTKVIISKVSETEF